MNKEGWLNKIASNISCEKGNENLVKYKINNSDDINKIKHY